MPELVTWLSESPDAVGWRSNGAICIVIECKTTRSDFLSDRNKPARRNQEDGAGHMRYYLTPPGLVRVDELPVDKHGARWGLLEVHGRIVRKISESGNFAIADHNMKSEAMLYSLLRRCEARGMLRRCLSKKWGGDALLLSAPDSCDS